MAVPLPLIQLMARRFYDAVEIHQPPQYIGVEPVDPQQGVALEVRLAKSRPCRHRFGRMGRWHLGYDGLRFLRLIGRGLAMGVVGASLPFITTSIT